MTLTANITNDYKTMDNLVSVSYYSSTGDGAWYDAATIENCTFFGTLRQPIGDDLRQTVAALIIRFQEWPNNQDPPVVVAAAPCRGDKFVLDGVTYNVIDVAADPLRRQQWTVDCINI